jgi:leucyl aminopeptidase
MYDSGGISLKPSDPMHLLMKMDMGGAASVLATFTALAGAARDRDRERGG